MMLTQHRRRGLGAVPCTGPTCPQFPITVMQPTTKHYTGPPGVQVSWTAGPAESLIGRPTQGGPCAYTSIGGQVMPGMWDSTFGCTPILHANPIQATNVPSGGATVLAPGTSVACDPRFSDICIPPTTGSSTTTTTSYVPWIIGAAAIVLVVMLLAR